MKSKQKLLRLAVSLIKSPRMQFRSHLVRSRSAPTVPCHDIAVLVFITLYGNSRYRDLKLSFLHFDFPAIRRRFLAVKVSSFARRLLKPSLEAKAVKLHSELTVGLLIAFFVLNNLSEAVA